MYKLYLNENSYSLARYLNSKGYYSFATHPFLSSGWSRTKAYPYLGFDSFTFIDEYPQRNLVRNFISDQEMFEYITSWYEGWLNKNSDPLFVFGVSMQNHSGYDYRGEEYTPSISLEGYGKKYEEAEQYLGLIHETDKALEYLIHYFETVDHDVVLCFFGDHLPNLSQSFYSELHGGQFNSLDEQQLLYTIPFFVWTNYDSEERKIDLASLNYLSSYVLEAAGIDSPPYNVFLQKTEEIIPSINSK